MKTFIFSPLLLSATTLFLVGCDKGKTGSEGGNPVMAPVEYLDTVAKAKISSEQKVDTIAVNQAIQMFSSQEGRYPTDLNELVVKGYMRQLPEPPYGMQFVYDAASGEVKVVKK